MLEGQVRGDLSKSQRKALRKEGYLLANLYGNRVPNVYASFKTNDFIRFVKNKPNLDFQVKVGECAYHVVVQSYQKDPVSNALMHVDLLVLNSGMVSKFYVPVKVHGTPVGLKNKGILMLSKSRVHVECQPEHLISSFELDVSSLDVGDVILVRDLELPQSVRILENPNNAVVGVIKAK
ncbi:50S ribosomal protein L25/general stress protein Ctc [Helicobacter salomonis]|uniref:50S ribosomal protein L25/general stress protein Ctc n=1 Tax=Helicobacter salomonis TaxID=56878 RepID=UPI000CF1A439|nr:50S ribosomal protein L25/general stress protein Ctc [Helicobacter salomonis]